MRTATNQNRRAPNTADPKRYCAIVFIGHGTSWCWGPNPQDAAKRAARFAKDDWKTLYKFAPKQEFTVLVYDMAEHDGWFANGVDCVFDSKTRERIPCHQSIKVTV